MTIQEFIDNAFTLHWIEDAKTYKNELVFVDIEDVVLARIPLDITPKTDMSEVYINKTYLEPEDIEQLKKWLLEFSKTPLRERDKSVRVYSETSEIGGNITLTNKTVLDPCCGGRMFYFNKSHPNVLYCDKRSEVVEMKDRNKIRTLEINPDTLVDVTRMSQFRDDEFSFVVFDPPHYINVGENSWLAKKYGRLDKYTWHEMLNKGLSECLRVVKPGCVVAMKWSEGDIKTIDMLKVTLYRTK